MENKLIPLTEFVNRIDELVPRDFDQEYVMWERQQLKVIKSYSGFLSQPLKLEYFVQVDDEGNVLNEPEWSDPLSVEEQEVYEHEQYLFEKAKSNILFEGFSVGTVLGEMELNHRGGIYGLDLTPKYFTGQTIEFLCEVSMIQESPIILSETALKQIYG